MVDSFLAFSTFVFTNRKILSGRKAKSSHHPHCGASGNRDGFLLPLFMTYTLVVQKCSGVKKKKRNHPENENNTRRNATRYVRFLKAFKKNIIIIFISTFPHSEERMGEKVNFPYRIVSTYHDDETSQKKMKILNRQYTSNWQWLIHQIKIIWLIELKTWWHFRYKANMK